MKHESLNGRIFTCEQCRMVHFEFKNFALDLKDIDALREMRNYLRAILANRVQEDDDFSVAAKMVIPFHGMNVKLLVGYSELSEIISLISNFINRHLEIQVPVGHKNIPPRLLNGISYLQLN